MATEKQFKLGITKEFQPLWEEFKRLVPKKKTSKMMRYLIYRFLYENGRKTSKNFEDSNDNDWKQIEGALKIHKKFCEKSIDVMEPYKIGKRTFWIEKYDYKIKDNVKTNEDIARLESIGYSKVTPLFSNSNNQNWKDPVDQEKDKIVLSRRLTKNEMEEMSKIKSSAEYDAFSKKINETKPQTIKIYLSQPNKYYVKSKIKMKAYNYYERAYNEFRNQRKNYKKNGIQHRPSIEDLYYLNQKLLGKLNEKNLLNNEIMKQFNEIERDFIINKGFKIHWRETPKMIDEHLLLNSQIIENKKKLITIKKDSERIYRHYTLLEFERGSAPKIIGPRNFVIQGANYEKHSEIYDLENTNE